MDWSSWRPVSSQAAQRGNGPVTVDFRAVTEDGQPILDLKGAEVSVRVDGKLRDVHALKLVQRFRAATVSRATPPFTTNGGGEIGRDLILLVDDDSGISPPVTAMRTTLGVQPGLCTVEPAHYEEVATAANQSRANFFAVLVVDTCSARSCRWMGRKPAARPGPCAKYCPRLAA
jgi:hypothetical protein